MPGSRRKAIYSLGRESEKMLDALNRHGSREGDWKRESSCPYPPSLSAMNILNYLSPSILCAAWLDSFEIQPRKCPKDELEREDWIARRDVMKALRAEFDTNVGRKEWRKHLRIAKQGRW